MREVTDLLIKLGTARPKLAILSATESPIPSVPSSMEGRELADWAKDNLKEADVSGPLAGRSGCGPSGRDYRP